MAAALLPILSGLNAKIVQNKDKIAEYAKMVGQQAGTWIKESVKLASDGFKYVQTHAAEIKAAIVEAFTFAKDAFKWIADHKEVLAAGAVASKAAPLAGVAMSGGASLGKALAEVSSVGLPRLGLAAGSAATGLGASAVALGAFGAAIAGVGLALYAFQQYLKETGGYLDPAKGEMAKSLDSRLEMAKHINDSFAQWDAGSIQRFQAQRAKAVEEATALGKDSRQVGAVFDAAIAQHTHMVEMTRNSPYFTFSWREDL
jgi:hypothetical protein